MTKPVYKRILLKLSGEALMGDDAYGINPVVLASVAREIKSLCDSGVQVGLVIGGGNIFRGASLATKGMDRVSADHMGMLATVMNALAMKNALIAIDQPCHVMSAIKMEPVCEDYSRDQSVALLESGNVVIFSAGTGNPFFTTDSAASLRAIEIHADIMIKATKVDGIYSADPVKNSDAIFYSKLTYDRVIQDNLNVMDITAIVLCKENNLPMLVLNMNEEGNLAKAISGEDVGTRVDKEV